MIHAAGCLFYNDDDLVLFLKRGAGSDHAGEWCFPGGQLEEGESALLAAKRETVEECGSFPEADPLELWTRQISANEVSADLAPIAGLHTDEAMVIPGDPVDYTTFRAHVPIQFAPTVNGEHTSWMWAPISHPPEPLHPGCRIALRRFSMNELDIGRAIMADDLTSPQKYMNISLFDIRITGTGLSYRSGDEEFVWRDPSIYLNQDFLDRANGLAVILEHPKGTAMTTEDYRERAIGSILIPYIKGEEVWGIAKINDEPAAEMMADEQLSTSPSVVFRGSAGAVEELENGKTLLVEGKPDLLDHIAVCRQGVWDKGGPPTGVNSVTTGDDPMPEEDKPADDTKSDAVKNDADGNIDKLLSKMDAMCARMDAWEAEDKKRADSKKDGEDMMMDDSEEDDEKKDSEDEPDPTMEEEDEPKRVVADKAKKDKVKMDAAAKSTAELRAELAATRAELADVASKLPKGRTDADYAALADAQGRADAVLSNFGMSASRPMDGESLLAYRRRLATGLKKYSQWKDVELSTINDDANFGIIEAQIYNEANIAALSPSSVEGIGLREIVKRDESGRTIRTFVGNPHEWLDRFGGSRKYLNEIRTKGVQ